MAGPRGSRKNLYGSSKQFERRSDPNLTIEQTLAHRPKPHGPRSLSGTGPENTTQEHIDSNYATEDFDDHVECFDQFCDSLTKYTSRNNKNRRFALGRFDEIPSNDFASFVDEYSQLFDKVLRKKDLRRTNRRSVKEQRKAEGWTIWVSSEGYGPGRTLSG
ncbi:MAG: hypothetical protein MMC33_001751 [Icmadophila ericetorum]|nr:hypothetical protein [Icmadophila ericetorum]